MILALRIVRGDQLKHIPGRTRRVRSMANMSPALPDLAPILLVSPAHLVPYYASFSPVARGAGNPAQLPC